MGDKPRMLRNRTLLWRQLSLLLFDAILLVLCAMLALAMRFEFDLFSQDFLLAGALHQHLVLRGRARVCSRGVFLPLGIGDVGSGSMAVPSVCAGKLFVLFVLFAFVFRGGTAAFLPNSSPHS